MNERNKKINYRFIICAGVRTCMYELQLTAITGAHKVTTVKALWLSAMKENSQWAMHS